MRYGWLDEYLLEKPGVSKDFKAEWNWYRYQLCDKLFAALCMDDKTSVAVYITLKLDPAEGEFLRRQYPDIIPGYYMNKQHWNSIKADGEVPDKSYQLVLKSLSKKKQAELLAGEESGNGV